MISNVILGFSTSIKLPLEAGFKKGTSDGCVILQNGKFSATSCDKKSSRTPEGLDTKVGYICENHNPCEVWSSENDYTIINLILLSVLVFLLILFFFIFRNFGRTKILMDSKMKNITFRHPDLSQQMKQNWNVCKRAQNGHCWI